MRSICLRLRRGDDLLLSIRRLAEREGLRCAAVLSGVGCVTEAHVRDASGVTVRHIALSREDMTTLGGHLMEGTVINTTCELVLLELDGWRCGVEQDAETGYDEIVFQEEA